MSKEIRIGFITPAWPGESTANGITTSIANTISGLQEIGCCPTIISINKSNLEKKYVIDLPESRKWSIKDRILGKFGYSDLVNFQISCERICSAVNFAINKQGINVLIMEETQGWAGPVQKRLPIPVIVTLRGPWFLHAGFHRDNVVLEAHHRRRILREKDAIMSCAGITAPSQSVLDLTGAKYDISRIPQAVIPNPMPAKDPVEYSTANEKMLRSLLFVGRFDQHKGGDIVLDAFSTLVERGIDTWLTFVGPDPGITRPNKPNLHIAEMLSRMPDKVRQRVKFLGRCSKKEINELRTQHGIAIIASRYENFPNTLLEALSAGAATVCTSVGGMTEIVRDGETGLFVPPNDPTALADACQRLITDQSLTLRLGAAARADIAERFKPNIIAEQFMHFIEENFGQRIYANV